MLKKSLITTAIIGATLPAYAAAANTETLEPIQIIGSEQNAQQLPGSGFVITPSKLKEDAITDINQVLKTVPGVYIHEEDGSGLRPNIGIRSATSERSEKITLMEDGILIAPAPYSNPAAYYFPTAMRMSEIEVLKGAPLLRHGPQTTGGIVNLISTPISETTAGAITTTMDSRSSTDIHANYGGKKNGLIWQLETVQRSNNGFKDIDRSNKDTGFAISDYVAKIGWQGKDQQILLKAQSSNEISNETYLGLTDNDFAADPNRRYGLSSIDQMKNDHQGISLTHTKDWSPTIASSAALYKNTFNRDWYKLSGGGTLISNANNGDANAQGILDGNIDTTGLQYKHNNRSYLSQGLQLNLDIEQGNHLVSVGARLHEDQMDRYQPVEVFNQVNGSLVYQSTTQPSGSNNRIETAKATSFWLVDDWQATEKLNVNLALRHENIRTERTQYADANRNTVASTRNNNSSIFLPGASLTYDINPSLQILTGYHHGFSPLGGGAESHEKPETSNNWEAGVRYQKQDLFVEAIAFYSDFANKTENCSLASPCSNGATSGTYITGNAEVSGLELQAGKTFKNSKYSVPIQLSYTYTQAEIKGDNATSGFADGDKLKSVPENTLSVRAGLEHPSGWNNYAVAKYIDKMCSVTGCNSNSNDFDETESLFTVDLTSHYNLSKNSEVFVKAENILNQQRIVSRTPDGARPNKPITLTLGINHKF